MSASTTLDTNILVYAFDEEICFNAETFASDILNPRPRFLKGTAWASVDGEFYAAPHADAY